MSISPAIDLGPSEQVEQEALVGGAAAEDHRGVGERAAQRAPSASARVRPAAMILAIIESNSAGTASPRSKPVSTRTPGPVGKRKRSKVPGAGAKARSGSSAQSRTSMAWPRRGRRLALEPAAGGHVELELHEIDPGRQLGHRVLDLEARVHLHEGGAPLARLAEELDGARVDVAGGARQPHRGVAERSSSVGSSTGAAPPRAPSGCDAGWCSRACPATRWCRAVGDDLHLDVARAHHHPLEEDGGVAEGVLGLGARRGEGIGELALGRHAADAAPAAARGRLEEEREAEAARVGARLVDARDRAAAPGRHRHAELLGELLGADLVAEAPHGFGAGADEDDTELGAEVGEGGVLRDEAPAHPGRLGAAALSASPSRSRSRYARRARAEEVPLVGLAHEHRALVGLGVERDRCAS